LIQFRAGEADLGFVLRRFGAPKYGAAAIFRETLRMMRRPAAGAVEPLFGGGPDFSPAIGADRVHLRCLSE
jgi:hypothetical protein